MKKVFDANDRVEAEMLVHALMENNIQAEVHGAFDAFEKPTVWVVDDETYDRATILIAEIEKPPESPNRQSAAPFRKTFRPAFWSGLFLGIVLGAVILFGLDKVGVFSGSTASEQWDMNGDGRIDCWREKSPDGSYVDCYDSNFDDKADSWQYYNKAFKIEKSVFDTNFDQEPDGWIFYDQQGFEEHNESDTDFNGKIDSWYYYRNAYLYEARFDNDGDGRIDEWFIYEGAKPVERKWSYANDGIIDKKVSYKNSRKYKEEYDRNRDGTFEETVFLDAFERAVNKKAK